jgi:hypothetical protein
MANLYEKLGITKEQLQEYLKNPQNMDPMTRDRIMKATRFSGTKILIGVLLPIILFGVGLFYGINYLTGTIIEQTAEVPGDATHFDPIASLEAVKAHAGLGSKLTSIDAMYVGSDGTLDITRTEPYSPKVKYELFVEADSEGKDAPPMGAGGVEGGYWYRRITMDVYEPGQWRHVISMGGGGSSEYSYQNKGMDKDEGSVQYGKPVEAPDPKCSFKDLWAAALEKGAPKDAVANIDYELTYKGEPKYTFEISGTDYDYVFDGECKIREEPFY